MSGRPWYKCYPRDLNEGMIGLTMEERGVYVTLLNLIYAKGGPVDDDPSYFRMVFCCSLKQWNKVRAALILKKKIFAVTVNGEACLMNRRAAAEIAANDEEHRSFSEAGKRGAEKSNARYKENKDLASARPQPSASISDTDTEGSVVPTDVETTDGKPSRDPADFDGQAWGKAVPVLRRGGLSDRQARSFFGKLLSEHRLLPRDMLPALTLAEINGTPEPQAYLAAAARALGGRRVGAKPQRVAFV